MDIHSKLILMRHGESLWNKEGRFTGWIDVDLSDKGREEAKAAAQSLKALSPSFSVAYTSFLKRAIRTLWIVLEELNLMWIPIHHSWRLNERHYGALQGKKKKEVEKEFGKEKTFLWRRSYNEVPPPLGPQERELIRKDIKYRKWKGEIWPASESLAQTQRRLLPYWKEFVLPQILSGENVLIVAHGNSLRALIKSIENLSSDEILNREVLTSQPILYQFNSKGSLIEPELS